MPKRVETVVLHDSSTPVIGDTQKGGNVVVTTIDTLLSQALTLPRRFIVFNYD